ncbi:MAG: SPOR domain-containing protein [Bacteroidaceae bacterium]|nr:SPOR domain-containing protein [Bacteroidaceae bacterium]
MKNYYLMGAVVCAAITMTSCKSSESQYLKAFEKAHGTTTTEVPATATTTPAQTAPVTVTPVQTITPTTTASEGARSENLTVVDGAGLKAFSVVVGAFKMKTNAETVKKSLLSQGYAAQLATNPQGLYRVIAATFDDEQSAVNCRNALRKQGAEQNNDLKNAWLLRK